MEKKVQKPKNKKIGWDNIIGIISIAAVVLTLLYVIGTYLPFLGFFAPSDAVEINYPDHILNGAGKEMAESMRGTEGVYKVIENEDGSLSVKMSPERQKKILDAAENAANAVPITSISENTAIQGFSTNEEHTEITINVFRNGETLENEVNDVLYVLRLYHVCNQNMDAVIKINYEDAQTGEKYMSEEYDITGNKISKSEQYTEEDVTEAVI